MRGLRCCRLGLPAGAPRSPRSCGQGSRRGRDPAAGSPAARRLGASRTCECQRHGRGRCCWSRRARGCRGAARRRRAAVWDRRHHGVGHLFVHNEVWRHIRGVQVIQPPSKGVGLEVAGRDETGLRATLARSGESGRDPTRTCPLKGSAMAVGCRRSEVVRAEYVDWLGALKHRRSGGSEFDLHTVHSATLARAALCRDGACAHGGRRRTNPPAQQRLRLLALDADSSCANNGRYAILYHLAPAAGAKRAHRPREAAACRQHYTRNSCVV